MRIKCGNNIVDSRIDHNKKLYGTEIKELLFLIETEEKDEFVLSMYNALNGGRNITDKMLSAIHNIIKRSQPMEVAKRQDWKERFLPRLERLREMIKYVEGGRIYTEYNHSYPFITSILDQAKKRGTLSKKQMVTLNSMYTKYTEKFEKKKSKEKK